MNNFDMKKIYYYLICIMAFFVLMWGVVDLASTAMGLYSIREAPTTLSPSAEESLLSPEKGDQYFDSYYQRRMLNDRLWDSLARILISGIVFVYFRYSASKLELKNEQNT
jgi:hypothetical protein